VGRISEVFNDEKFDDYISDEMRTQCEELRLITPTDFIDIEETFLYLRNSFTC